HGDDEHLQFYCTHRDPDSLDASERSQPIPKCPATDKLAGSCNHAGPNGTHSFTDKEQCLDLCNSLYDGTYLKEALKCFEDGCSDWEKHEGHNKEAQESVVEEMKAKCHSDLGLKGVTSKNGTIVDDSEKDSEATGLGVKKGALVLALVFGSVFSGLLM